MPQPSVVYPNTAANMGLTPPFPETLNSRYSESSDGFCSRHNARPTSFDMPASKTATEPRTRDAERSRQDILEAACVAFAQTELGGTRLEHVAERAGVD